MLNCVSEKISEYKTFDFKTKLAVVSVASLFLPYFISSVFILVVLIYTVVNNKIRKDVINQSGARFFLLIPILTVLPSIYAKNLLGVLGAIAVFGVFNFGLYLRRVLNEKTIHFSLNLVCVASVFSFLVAVIQMIIIRSGNIHLYKSPYLLINYDYFNGLLQAYSSYRSVSTFFNANYFATIAGLVALIALYKLLLGKSKKVFYSFIFLVNILSILLSGSRTALIAVCVSTLVLLVLFKRYKILLGVIGGIFVIGVIFAFNIGYIPRIDSLPSTVDYRLDIWTGAVKLLSNLFTLVFGQGMWAYRFNALNGAGNIYAVHSHNILLECLLCFGTVGVGLIITYICKQLVIIRRNITNSKTNLQKLMLGAATFVLISGITDVIITGLETCAFILFLFSSVGIFERGKDDV